LETEIRHIVDKAIESESELFLVDIKVKGNLGNQKVLVFIDGDKGVSIEQCGKISRAIGGDLEEKELFTGKYTLEVSSPGLDHPITLHRQYVKNIGRELEVILSSGERVEGKLEEVKEDLIALSSKGGAKNITFEEIKQSKIKVSFK